MGDDEALRRIQAHLEIQQLPIRYANCMDRKDVEGLVPLFSERINMGAAGRGPDAVRAFYRKAWSRFGRSVHRISNHQIDIVDDVSATGTVYCFGEQQSHDGSWECLMLAYEDGYMVEGGRWRFKSRRLGIWYRRPGADRELGPGPTAGAMTLPDDWTSWQTFVAGGASGDGPTT